MHGPARTVLFVAVFATGLAATLRALPESLSSAPAVNAYAIVGAPYGSDVSSEFGDIGLVTTMAVVNADGSPLQPALGVVPDALSYGTRSLATSAESADSLKVIQIGGAPGAPDSPVIDASDANISVRIPSVSFGATDGLPSTLRRGQSYTVTFPLIGADPVAVPTASIIGRGLALDPACTNYPLLPVGVTQLTCTVTVRANALSAQVRASANGIGSRIVRHGIDPSSRATASVSATPSTSNVGFGSPRSLVVSVTAPGYTPTGNVTVTVDGSTTLPPVRLNSGSAEVALPVDLSIGTHLLAASYSGDNWLSGVASPTAKITVQKATPVVAASSSLGFTGAIVSATVTAAGIATVTGSVTVSEGSAQVAQGTLSGGTFRSTLPASLSSGDHRFTVSYGGSATVAPASTQVVITIP